MNGQTERDDDAMLAELFRQWLDALDDLNHKPGDLSGEDDETLLKIERAIAERPAIGAAGFAIKAAVLFHASNQCDRNRDPLRIDCRLWRSLIEDSIRLVPEVASLADALPPKPLLFMTDAELLAAEKEIAELRAQSTALLDAGDNEDHPEIDVRVTELEEAIARSPASGLVGAAVKLRRLADPGVGIEAGPAESDTLSVRQILETVEREIAKGGANV